MFRSISQNRILKKTIIKDAFPLFVKKKKKKIRVYIFDKFIHDDRFEFTFTNFRELDEIWRENPGGIIGIS